jgi:prolyl-tRNA editing enzyme YbaK/EbsC (Cys-tRNA(Pro) deacylase)
VGHGPGQPHPGLARVVAAAASTGLVIEVERFPEGTRTAADAARAVGCHVAQIVKSLVFVADGEPVIALVSGADRLDPARLAAAVGATVVRRADGDEARAATGFAIGGVPPFGHIRALRVVMDERLLAHDVVWAAAGLPDAVFRARPRDLQATSGARVAALAAIDAPSHR